MDTARQGKDADHFLEKELLPFFFQPHLWSRSGMGQTQGNLVLFLLFIKSGSGASGIDCNYCFIGLNTA
jgi:hypothetical protein